ncbi:bifunctional [glutamine synthetase] adenylyltransferase/[glutamine synthetase]-adenylyl-L-tyrosine phosphorylase [Corynebacterium canis]|uniref:Bifunctional glutamine synthetase adenylyltransferase/adenylyl-removing enzyme n=1 Tax=Corynebacterium canis TaxID=679663 RepID=A0A5C5UQ07_9CORY|nr:bifunctional [glutamine synthetase] adenylyltransferase/[glutamine synthetase]-adenylyl-L-tyrosine phosphorylase [Corynebacterium canis]TWT28581.1 bifunctional [glutamine synthetase] adenylyltransferase/[glutamine synthetase]-adenylyl-L-tyrosine phosphorylase [Corynebacterium canis]WJY75828.1 Glutamate-ammonia-ligase adenylyltransferase [Corynebacterium canis]
MATPRSTRRLVPTPGGLSLEGPHAQADLEWLGWMNPDSVELLWSLTGAADPDLALNTLVRLMQALGDERAELDRALREEVPLRVRLVALLGASTSLGDHLVANPQLWRQLSLGLPTATEMMQQMLECVAAVPAELVHMDDENVAVADPDADTASADLSTPGTYKACVVGTEAEQRLERTYRTLLMRIAAHDLAGTYPESPRRPGQPHVPFTVVSGALSDLADAALTAALAVAVACVYGEKPVSARLAVLAMGKCGARELNYISDVDVIFVAEPADARTTRLAGEFIRLGCRCFFEVDAALRPEGKQGALVRTLESHVAYYKRWAHTWEFQALLKARPMTGAVELGNQYVTALAPLVWNASQRESFVDDVQAMRRRVINNVPAELRERELKLGKGGLRDVEFAVQLLQMVHGRVDESLRRLGTVDALTALMKGGYVGREDAHALISAYEFLRLLEHRLQLQRLRRTHTMPADKDVKQLRWLARAAGIVAQGNQGTAAEELGERFRKVALQISSMHAKLFYRPLLNSVASLPVETLRLSAESAKLQLAALRYTFPERAYEHLVALASGRSRKAKIQAMLLPTLMEWLSQTADPDMGLLNYRRLSDAAEDRQWFLRMLRDEGVVGQRLMRILGNSPYVSDLILATPDSVKLLGDGATGPKLLAASPDTVSRSLLAASSRYADPEKAIRAARSLRRAELARVAAADLLDMMDVQEVCRSLSLVWDAVLDAALAAEIRGSVPEGEQPPARIAVIGMGRLGGAELGYGSDADVMFVCEPAENVSDNNAVRWAVGVCDRMRRRLAKPSDDPPLEVDLGLRPEGRSGPIVRTLDSYEKYYERWGETWEIQALLRASVVAGDREVGREFLHRIDPLRYPAGGVSAETVREVRRMKARVDNERLPRGADRNTHTKLGRGALTDIEWTVQLLIMLHAHEVPGLHNTSTLECLDVIEQEGLLPKRQAETLRAAWLAATQARNALVLVRGKRTDQLPPPGPQLAQVAGAAGWDPTEYQQFLENYLRLTRRARQVVDEVFWGETTFEP